MDATIVTTTTTAATRPAEEAESTKNATFAQLLPIARENIIAEHLAFNRSTTTMVLWLSIVQMLATHTLEYIRDIQMMWSFFSLLHILAFNHSICGGGSRCLFQRRQIIRMLFYMVWIWRVFMTAVDKAIEAWVVRLYRTRLLRSRTAVLGLVCSEW